jgi:DNA primase
MRHRGFDFHEAARHLAKEAGVEVEPEPEHVKKRRKQEEDLARANTYANAFFMHALWSESGRRARAYLAERGLPEDFAKERELGFGGGPGELLRYLEAKRVRPEVAAEAGFLTQDAKKSLFDGRLIFPIYDQSDRLAGFGGRRMQNDDSPKYVNSRDGVLFAKRSLLYGWREAKEHIRRSERVVLCEGYMDVLACHRGGIGEAVAALGTSFTDEHAKTVSRLAKEAVALFDGDAAGSRAARSATEKLLGHKLKALYAPLPPGDDPDSLLKKAGAPALKSALAAAKPAVEHFIQTELSGASTIEDKARAAEELASLILALGTGLERDLYTARLAEKVGVSVEQLEQHVLRGARAKLQQRRAAEQPQPAAPAAPQQEAGKQEPPKPTPPPGPAKPELQILEQLLLHPELRPKFAELAEYASDAMRLLFEELARSVDPLEVVLERHVPDAQKRQRLIKLQPASAEHDLPHDAASRTFEGALKRLKLQHVKTALEEAKSDLAERQAHGDEIEDAERRVQTLTRTFHDLKRPR